MLVNSPLISIATLAPLPEIKRGNRNYKTLVLTNRKNFKCLLYQGVVK
jgi:hypothetical protein